MFGKGHLFELVMGSPFVAPTVVRFVDEHVPDSDTVFGGEGSCAVTMTPWPCPIAPEVYSADEARRFLSRRADAAEWLSRLSQKSLACNCNLPPDKCWAWILREKFMETFGNTVDDDEQQTFDVEDDDLDDDWAPAEDDIPEQWHSSARDEIGTTADDVASIPAHVPWPTSWVQLVQTVRGLQRPVFWEFFSGCTRMTGAFRDEGIQCAPPIDAADNPEYNLLNAMFLALVVGLLGAHLIDLLHLAPPCSSFSVILNACLRTQLRTKQMPHGIEGLDWEQARQVRTGNALAETAAVLVKAQHAAGNHFQMEQPARSLMVEFEAVKLALQTTGAVGYQRDACVDGSPWRKALVLHTATKSVGRRLAAQCPGCPEHIRLRGKAPNGIDWTKVACPYWPAWTRSVAGEWVDALISHEREHGWERALR